MPGRPSASGYSNSAGVGVTGLSWTGTPPAAGQAIYVVVHSTRFGLTQPTLTCDGVAMTPRFSGSVTGLPVCGWVFSLPAADVVAGPCDFVFDNSTVPASTYVAQAFNVANAPSDACAILPAQEATGFTTSFAKRAYAWDPLGLMIVSGWVGTTGVGSLSPGTTIGSGSGAMVNTFNAADDLELFTLARTVNGLTYLIGFLIPPDETSQPRTGGGFYPWFTERTVFGSGGPGLFATAPLPRGGSATQGRECNILICPGTVHTWVVNSNMPVGAGNTVVAEIYRGGGASGGGGGGASSLSIPTGITLTLSGDQHTEVDRRDLAALLSWARYEKLSIRYTFTAGTTLPPGLQVWASFLTESGESGAQIYGGGPQTFFGDMTEDAANYKAPLHPVQNSWGASDSNKSLVGIKVRQTELLVTYQQDAVTEHDYEFFMEKRLRADPLVGVLHDGSGGTVDTAAMYPLDTIGPAIARSRFSLSWDVGDLMAFVGFKRNSDGGTPSNLRHAATLKIVAEPGQFMLSGHSDRTLASSYVGIPNQPIGSDTLANEELNEITTPPMGPSGDSLHLRGIIHYLEDTGPDAGTLRHRLRKNQGDTSMPDLVLAGSPSDPLYGEVDGDVAYDDLDKISQQFICSDGPTLERQFWSFTGGLTPTPERGCIGPHQWIKFPRTIPEITT